MAALAQQHWGAGLDARHLPGSWSSTGNALEGQAFAAKDAIFVIDDFVAGATLHDQARLHREADRVFRAQGNRSGRGRMRADGGLRPPKPPRGLILSTGEDIPRGQSLRSRILVLEVETGAVNWERLSVCQQDAAAGLYAQALAAFVRWLAPRYDDDSAEVAGRGRRIAGSGAAVRSAPAHARDRREPGAWTAPVSRLCRGDGRHYAPRSGTALWKRGWAALGDGSGGASQIPAGERADPPVPHLPDGRARQRRGPCRRTGRRCADHA